MSRPPTTPAFFFFSYAHEDEARLDELRKFLRPLLREVESFLAAWHDRDILPGRPWSEEIDEHLAHAEVILLLVSADFLASDDCDREMRDALALREAGRAEVVPVLLRPADWQSGPLGRLQVLPKDGRPLLRDNGQEEAFLQVVGDIRRIVEARLAVPRSALDRDPSSRGSVSHDPSRPASPEEAVAHGAGWFHLIAETFLYDPADASTWESAARLKAPCLAALLEAEALGVPAAARLPLLRKLASYLRDQGELHAAKSLLEQEVALAELEWGPGHPELAASLDRLGLVLLDLAELDSARSCFDRAQALLDLAGRARSAAAAEVRHHLGLVQEAQGEWQSARGQFEQAAALAQELLGLSAPETAHALCHLAFALRELGEQKPARAGLLRALAALEPAGAEGPLASAARSMALGRVQDALGQRKSARLSYTRAFKTCRQFLRVPHPLTAAALGNLALASRDSGKLDQALAWAEEALATDEEVYGDEHPAVAADLNTLGFVLRDLGRESEARSSFRRALRILVRTLGEGHPHTKAVQEQLGGLFQASG